MPYKVCTNCGEKNGPRKKECSCGQPFTPKNVTRSTRSSGLPSADPEPLPDGKISNRGLAQYISAEGLGYCVHDWIPTEQVGDPEIAELWAKAKAALGEINYTLQQKNLTG